MFTIPLVLQGCSEAAKCTGFDRTAQLSHQIMVKMQIMVGHQHGPKHLAAPIQMMQVGPGKILAGIAAAVFV
jgi:hypothetical protein